MSSQIRNINRNNDLTLDLKDMFRAKEEYIEGVKKFYERLDKSGIEEVKNTALNLGMDELEANRHISSGNVDVIKTFIKLKLSLYKED